MAKVLKRSEIIIWDECTMAHKKALEALDRTLRDLRESNKIMGGLFILLAGDFRQTLPVIPRSTESDEMISVEKCKKNQIIYQYASAFKSRYVGRFICKTAIGYW